MHVAHICVGKFPGPAIRPATNTTILQCMTPSGFIRSEGMGSGCHMLKLLDTFCGRGLAHPPRQTPWYGTAPPPSRAGLSAMLKIRRMRPKRRFHSQRRSSPPSSCCLFSKWDLSLEHFSKKHSTLGFQFRHYLPNWLLHPSGKPRGCFPQGSQKSHGSYFPPHVPCARNCPLVQAALPLFHTGSTPPFNANGSFPTP